MVLLSSHVWIFFPAVYEERFREMLKLMLACCKVYISESRNRVALDSIEQAAKLFPQAAIINKFEDETYNRVGYTLVSKVTPEPSSGVCPLKTTVFAMVKAAFEAIDLESHRGSHPRLGVVDHICFHPLGCTSLDRTAALAKSLAADIGSTLQGLLPWNTDSKFWNNRTNNLVVQLLFAH